MAESDVLRSRRQARRFDRERLADLEPALAAAVSDHRPIDHHVAHEDVRGVGAKAGTQLPDRRLEAAGVLLHRCSRSGEQVLVLHGVTLGHPRQRDHRRRFVAVARGDRQRSVRSLLRYGADAVRACDPQDAGECIHVRRGVVVTGDRYDADAGAKQLRERVVE